MESKDHDLLVEIHTRQNTILSEVASIKEKQDCSAHNARLIGHDNKFKIYDKIFLITPALVVIGIVAAWIKKNF